MPIKPRDVSLDLLRIFAAYWVLAHHWTVTEGFMSLMKKGYTIPEFPHVLEAILRPGFLGVDIFFILSGIVISKSAIGRSWKKFAEARFIRLFPAYFIATIIAVILAPLTMTERPPTHELLMSLTGLQWFYGYPTIIGPAWTLFYEVRFYIIIAILIAITGIANYERMHKFAIIWVTALVFAPNINIPAFNFLAISDYGVYFCYGMILGITPRNSIKANMPLIIIGFAIAWVRLQARYSAISTYSFEAEIVSIFILLTITVIAFRPSENSFIQSEKTHKMVTILALATYPVYLLHEPIGMPLIAELAQIGLPFSLSFLLALILVTLISIYFATNLEKRIGTTIRKIVFSASSEKPKNA